MDKETFNKFQWSGSYGGNMIVIRSNNQGEFDTLVLKYEEIVASKVKPPMETNEQKVANFAREYEANEGLCPEHNVPMLSGFSKKISRPYKYHDDNGQRCFGKGYKPPLR